MKEIYVFDAVRSAIGKYAGSLSTVRPDDLASHVIKALMSQHPEMDWKDCEEVILGAANQAGEDNRNVARMAALLAGLPQEVAGITVNRLCASGLQAIMDGFRALRNGDGEMYIVGGTESMTRAPFVMAKSETAFGRTPEIYDTTIGWRFTNKTLASMYPAYTMGETAENVAERWGISREEQDAFAMQSQERFNVAQQKGTFKSEIVPIEVKQGKKSFVFDTDEHPRLTDLATLAGLKPAFKKVGTVTAGNSSGVNDGAAALLIGTDKIKEKYNLKPMARIVAVAAAGVDPAVMGVGPVPAVRKVLERAGLKVEDIDLFELNEAFASQSIACMRELGLDASKVNVNGGAIALGHPLGCSGARISTTLLHEMKRRGSKYGIATMCVGVGQGAAILYENLA
ncbi:MAG: acetyl-CoA C-acyltransferase [Chitinophagales bacterium]|nr:acetyl-CoA C-acyltransferase [Chitinophagales bacterium]